jgi:acyl-CoA thioester hydrolase
MNMKKPANLGVKIYFEDTDAGDVVYHANYLRYLERARVEWLSRLGYEQRTLAEKSGISFVVSRLEISYKVPARLDDRLEVQTTPIKLGSVRIVFRQDILFLESRVLAASAEVEVACVNLEAFRLARMPKELVKGIRAMFPEMDESTPEPGARVQARDGAGIEGCEVLRLASRPDREILAELNRLLHEEERYDRSFTYDDLIERMDGFLDAGSDYDTFIIASSEETAGYALVNRAATPPYIRQFYVRPAFRRRGLGRTAVHEIKRYYGTSALDAEVMAWNDLGMKFWTSLGFIHRYNGLRLRG